MGDHYDVDDPGESRTIIDEAEETGRELVEGVCDECGDRDESVEIQVDGGELEELCDDCREDE